MGLKHFWIDCVNDWYGSISKQATGKCSEKTNSLIDRNLSL
jgi:hypothetical protein